MKIEKAKRKAIPFVGCFYGKSGSGKTYSAIKLATGLVDGDNICLIDTENGRASHYADEFDNLFILNLEPPFTPRRYIEAVRLAEKEGFKAIVIDSISHEWDGLGGCLEMAEKKTSQGKEKKGLNKWAKPKSEHRKLMNMLLQSKSHIIFCARAKDEFEQVDNKGRAEIINKGEIPIQERNFPYEMLVTFRMESGGKAHLEKCIKSLRSSLQIKNGGFIDESHGKMILDWINKGEKVDLEAKRLKEEARDIAMHNGEGKLKKWFANLADDEKEIASRFSLEFKKDLTRIAKERDSLDEPEYSTIQSPSLPDLKPEFDNEEPI